MIQATLPQLSLHDCVQASMAFNLISLSLSRNGWIQMTGSYKDILWKCCAVVKQFKASFRMVFEVFICYIPPYKYTFLMHVATK